MCKNVHRCVCICVQVCVSMVHEDMGMHIAVYILYVYKRINILHVCIGVCIVAHKGMFADIYIYIVHIYIGRYAGV